MLSIIYIVLAVFLFLSHFFNIIELSYIPYYFFIVFNVIYIGLVVLRPQILLKIQFDTENKLINYFNILSYFLFVAYFFFISDLKLSTPLSLYMVFTYFLSCCIKYFKKHKQ